MLGKRVFFYENQIEYKNAMTSLRSWYGSNIGLTKPIYTQEDILKILKPSMNMDASSGYPYMKLGYKKKKDFFEDKDWYIHFRNFTDPPVAIPCAKQEMVDVDLHTRSKKVRTFFPAPITANLGLACVFTEASERLIARGKLAGRKKSQWSFYGFSPFYSGAHELFKALKIQLDSGYDIVTSDVSGYDRKVPNGYCVRDMRASFINWNETPDWLIDKYDKLAPYIGATPFVMPFDIMKGMTNSEQKDFIDHLAEFVPSATYSYVTEDSIGYYKLDQPIVYFNYCNGSGQYDTTGFNSFTHYLIIKSMLIRLKTPDSYFGIYSDDNFFAIPRGTFDSKFIKSHYEEWFGMQLKLLEVMCNEQELLDNFKFLGFGFKYHWRVTSMIAPVYEETKLRCSLVVCSKHQEEKFWGIWFLAYAGHKNLFDDMTPIYEAMIGKGMNQMCVVLSSMDLVFDFFDHILFGFESKSSGLNFFPEMKRQMNFSLQELSEDGGAPMELTVDGGFKNELRKGKIYVKSKKKGIVRRGQKGSVGTTLGIEEKTSSTDDRATSRPGDVSNG